MKGYTMWLNKRKYEKLTSQFPADLDDTLIIMMQFIGSPAHIQRLYFRYLTEDGLKGVQK